MKHVYLLAIAIFSFLSSFAANNVVKVNNGSWTSSSTWSLGHTPQNGEVLIIPDGFTLVVNNNVSFSPNNVVIKVYGTIRFSVGKLNLGSSSLVEIHDSGELTTGQGNNSDRITIGGLIVYSGSMGLVGGPLMMSISGNTVLPVRFVHFSAHETASGVSIDWAVEEEQDSDSYVVERSNDGINWSAIGQVASKGSVAEQSAYTFLDNSPGYKLTYYRVKQISNNGEVVYTSIKSVQAGHAAAGIKVFYSNKNLKVDISKEGKGQLIVRIISINGQVLLQKQYDGATRTITINTEAYKGHAVLSITNGRDIYVAKQVLL